MGNMYFISLTLSQMFSGNSVQSFRTTTAELDFWRALLADVKASPRNMFSWAKVTSLRDFKAEGFLERRKDPRVVFL